MSPAPGGAFDASEFHAGSPKPSSRQRERTLWRLTSDAAMRGINRRPRRRRCDVKPWAPRAGCRSRSSNQFAPTDTIGPRRMAGGGPREGHGAVGLRVMTWLRTPSYDQPRGGPPGVAFASSGGTNVCRVRRCHGWRGRTAKLVAASVVRLTPSSTARAFEQDVVKDDQVEKNASGLKHRCRYRWPNRGVSRWGDGGLRLSMQPGRCRRFAGA